ncbi:hypothetical protein Godav_024595 [Gossypium davidsonii]|uniref:Uncharacterized protein n=2 Tax=Gossypium TaxID=3633 RepID=A0A7J8TJZ4_GOSDV|nr:hypothetical protein [Gossypium davidsonii]MBA0672788.1 hypothetical protein [Gossypium klotzschianum]
MTSRKRNRWQSFKIYKRRISSGELRGYFQMRSCQDSLCLQPRDWLSVNSRIKMMVTKRRLVR